MNLNEKPVMTAKAWYYEQARNALDPIFVDSILLQDHSNKKLKPLTLRQIIGLPEAT
jgi:hypothetical protein